ncbi:hypothetical protein [Bradyrhizobium guangdongense]|uniref:hypothetical protein n=1 Tax=Bradyrhizobium guangdongense TaxID=1325090 RepID=UPI001126953D|nr:hypothetical protein [Bradyrhizobium guangdongense]
MRFLLPLVLLPTAAAAAEAVDCNAIVTTMAPVELTYHEADKSSVTQIFRDPSGNSVVWVKTMNGKFVGRADFAAGVLATAETSSAFAGKFKSSKINYTVEGMPKLFDRRSDLNYSTTHSSVYGDGSTDTATTTYHYKFKSAGKEAVGPCMLDVVHGESDSVNEKTGKTAHTYGIYFPQLMAGISGHTTEPVIDGIKTTFDPMALIP